MINVGIVSENEEGILAVKRGSKLALKVGKDFGSEQVLVIAIKITLTMISFSVEMSSTYYFIQIRR